ncbi:ABC transporter permease [Pseudothermotoga thermarum]|uniref:ABC transporter permease n=1 Tax=Pseudothermotoga thermarum TaxID=119394 RepID=UPI001FE14341|nr:ABC transporter permease subunit [Pseudothermotoga thermarum]
MLFNTFAKAILSLSLALLVGTLLGFLMGIFNWFNLMFKPLAMVLRSVPIVSWLSTVLFLWGIGWRSVVFIVFMTLLPQIMFNVAEGVRTIDVKLVEMAKVYNVPKRKVFKTIYMGSLVPFLVSAINVSIGTMWKSAIVAEYLLGGTGLGVRIQEAKFFINTPRVFALTLSAVFVGLGLEFVFSWLWEKKLYGKSG